MRLLMHLYPVGQSSLARLHFWVQNGEPLERARQMSLLQSALRPQLWPKVRLPGPPVPGTHALVTPPPVTATQRSRLGQAARSQRWVQRLLPALLMVTQRPEAQSEGRVQAAP